MGSLMAGWNSPVLDSKTAAYKRNRSFTKEEIEAYWRSKQKTEEEHLKDISTPSDTTNQQEAAGKVLETGRRYERSSSTTLPNRKEDVDDETSIDKLINKNGWWTRSNWAFLNEPPVNESASNTYAPQFHVARMASSKG
ncbi:hypothetical protein FNV43_RR11512 [Rhamnella rubrinervis]|uniref:Uncharacterized protein n=1 Tax=Rhamnella rubrinervis TaxID=2594499 RepID=A0A8K0MHX7_9ROSA|nr:hypothetical protein FNV43_RR11512 [Rhamnella rubrinervis]